jgi:hypothetical protein
VHPGTVAVADWSGAARNERAGLWLAEWDGATGTVRRVGPHSRVEAVQRLLALADHDPDMVAGLDFGFSMPAWWLEHNAIAAAPELWADSGRLEGWLAACAPPFWGRPGRRRPDLGGRSQWRRTEVAAPVRPRSVFQIGGAGAVGTASLRGMPALAALRHGGVAVWPFDDWRLPAVVEVWPRLAIGPLVKSSERARAGWVAANRPLLHPLVAEAAERSPDAFDAAAAALALAGRDRIARPSPDDPGVVLEGWIDGVPLPTVTAADRMDG